jgi:hypothetical protein
MVAFYLSSNRKDEENKFASSNKFRKYFQFIPGTGDEKPISSPPLLACLKSKSSKRPARPLPRRSGDYFTIRNIQFISGTGDGKCFPMPHCFVLRRTSRSSPFISLPQI